MKHVKTLNTRKLQSTVKKHSEKGRMRRMPDILPICLQDKLHGREPELREQIIPGNN